MENTKLLKNLENMKSDIYYLNSIIKRIELELKENNQKNIQNKEEIHFKHSNENKLNYLNENMQYLRSDVSKIHTRINGLENNQENLTEFVDDLDSKISKIVTSHVDNSKLSKSIVNSLNDVLHQKLREMEQNVELQISKIYDTMYNEILDLKVEIKKSKKKTISKKEDSKK
ncbi:MAG: hypothetical protein LAT82_03800 [Nanoarchaeota archaeon]|nr:hypothetical protein [Nanoarchaeota archaeon]